MIQLDHRIRVVSVANLRAMCVRASGMVHRYWVEKVSRSRLWVGYSNPDEWAAEHPMFAIFPCYPNSAAGDGGRENLVAVLDFLRVVNDTWEGEGWQAFTPLIDCVQLWYNPEMDKWASKDEIALVKMSKDALN